MMRTGIIPAYPTKAGLKQWKGQASELRQCAFDSAPSTVRLGVDLRWHPPRDG